MIEQLKATLSLDSKNLRNFELHFIFQLWTDNVMICGYMNPAFIQMMDFILWEYWYFLD